MSTHALRDDGARRAGVTTLVWALLGIAGCGARSELEVLAPPPLDAGVDAFTCRPSVEACNDVDDDCDGRIDEAMPLVALGPPIVLRDDTELDAGDCTTCFWAWSPVLAPAVGGGYRSIFRISIYGGREEPNLFVRPLDAHGFPLGPNESAGREVALDLRAMDTPPGAPRTIATCWRVGTDDVPGLTRIAADGTITRNVYADGRRCEELTLVGDRMVSVTQRGLRADVRSRLLDGSGARTTEIPLENVYSTFAAASGDRVGIVLLHIEDDVRELYFTVVSALGDTVVAPRRIDVPYDSYPDPRGTSEGWLLVMPGMRGLPARHAVLGLDGSLRVPLATFDDLHELSDSGLTDTFVHHPSAPLFAHVFQESPGDLDERMHVQLLDERGATLRAFEDDAPGTGVVGSPSVLFAGDGRILVTWHDIEADSTRNRVYLRELGCPP